MNINKIGAVVLSSRVNCFIGSNSGKMFLNVEYVCASDKLMSKYRHVGAINFDGEKYWDY